MRIDILGVVGPEYISMVSAEAKRPRIYIKNAFKTVYIRLAIFFVGGSLCAGIVVAYNVRSGGLSLTRHEIAHNI